MWFMANGDESSWMVKENVIFSKVYISSISSYNVLFFWLKCSVFELFHLFIHFYSFKKLLQLVRPISRLTLWQSVKSAYWWCWNTHWSRSQLLHNTDNNGLWCTKSSLSAMTYDVVLWCAARLTTHRGLHHEDARATWTQRVHQDQLASSKTRQRTYT